MSDFNREPIFWTAVGMPSYNKGDREVASFKNGRRVVEKVPQRAHIGAYDDRRQNTNYERWQLVVRHDGHTVRQVLTTAAAHTDANTTYAQNQRNKAMALGWFKLHQCPLALVRTGQMSADKIAATDMLKPTETACSGAQKEPCVHALAEIAARQLIRQEESAVQARAYRGPMEKMMEANRANVEATVKGLTEALTAASTVSAAPSAKGKG